MGQFMLRAYEIMQIRLALAELISSIESENNRLEKVDAIFFDNIIAANANRISELKSLRDRSSESTDM